MNYWAINSIDIMEFHLDKPWSTDKDCTHMWLVDCLVKNVHEYMKKHVDRLEIDPLAWIIDSRHYMCAEIRRFWAYSWAIHWERDGSKWNITLTWEKKLRWDHSVCLMIEVNVKRDIYLTCWKARHEFIIRLAFF